MRNTILIGLLAAIILTGGCAKHLMPTPVIAGQGLFDPFANVPPDDQDSEVDVFIASARTVSGREDSATFYTNERSREVRLGKATVEIGAGMTWDELAEQSLAKKRDNNPVVKLTGYEEYGPLWTTAWPPDFRFARDWDAPDIDRGPAEQFAGDINERLAISRRKQIIVFVHGFNTKFASNATNCAEMLHYTGRDGVIISFDWPSKGNMFSYQVDKANARFAERQFRRLLEFLAAETTAEEINILAHSAGNPVVAEALRQISLTHYDKDPAEIREQTKIGRVVFAAPDMDLGQLVSVSLDGGGRVTRGFTVYASRKDKALSFSGTIFGDVRVGRSIGKLEPDMVEALKKNGGLWVDATAAQNKKGSFLGHSYYHNNPWVSSDLLIFLRTGASAAERGLVMDEETGFMIFPKNYEEKLPQVLKTLNENYSIPQSQ